jgi:hypothetical protein
MTKARVLSFHVDADELPGLTEALDGVAETLALNSDFVGLVCLEHDNVRNEIMVITLWDGDGLEDSVGDAERARHRIAATTDLGVSSKCYDVLRLVRGPATFEGVLADAAAR